MISVEHLKELAHKYEDEVGAAVHDFVVFVERKLGSLFEAAPAAEQPVAADVAPVADVPAAPAAEAPAADPAPVEASPAPAADSAPAPAADTAPAAATSASDVNPVDASPAADPATGSGE